MLTMKSANEMFEELGYEMEETYNQIIYKNYRQLLDFNKTSKNISIFMNGCSNYQGFQINDIKLLQAINKQVEELHWKVD